MGWSMGWDPDGHRTIRPVQQDEFQIISNPDAPAFIYAPPDSREVVLYYADGFIPDTLHIHTKEVHITEFESIWSSAFRLNPVPPDEETFAPVVDNNWTVVGHIGWADGTNIVVPEYTIRNGRYFWFLMQKARLESERQRLLDDAARHDPLRPYGDSAFLRMEQKKRVASRPNRMVDTRTTEAERGPLADKSLSETYVTDLDMYVKGGGKAYVGRNLREQGDALYLPSVSGVPDGRLGSPKTLYSSGFQFLVLLDPEGRIQRVMDVRYNIITERDLVIPMIEFALELSMLIDIVPLVVVLLAAGVKLALRVTIQAVRFIVDRAAKGIVDVALKELSVSLGTVGVDAVAREAVETALRRGAMSGPERTEAKTAWGKIKQEFWAAGNVRPTKTFTDAEVKKLNEQIGKRMEKLGVPKENRGAGVRRFPPKSDNVPASKVKMQPFDDEPGTPFNPKGGNRGRNMANQSYDPAGYNESGISVHGNVFDDWKNFDLWNDPTTKVEDRIDAVIVHELGEFNGLTHWESVEVAPGTKLPISKRARELLRYMRIMGEPDMALTEFTKAQWEAIVAAGKTTASFEEKLRIAVEVAAKAAK